MFTRIGLCSIFGLLISACTQTGGSANPEGRPVTYVNPATTVNDTAAPPTTYQDPNTNAGVRGVGIESQDIVSMTDVMVRDILAVGLNAGGTAPQIIMDEQRFKNLSAQRINKRLIISRLRIQLQRAAAGRLVFLSRENIDLVQKERSLQDAGAVDRGAVKSGRGIAGADYRLVGEINTLDQRTPSGAIERYNQINFELIDLETGVTVWANGYEFSKFGQDDVIYR